MLCQKLATRKDGIQFPCGQCNNCRINHRRAWQARLLLEAASHEYSAFLTLTFADKGTPHFLRRSDIHGFNKTLRQFLNFRFFCAAEYGKNKGRAHYHIHIFGDKPILPQNVNHAWPYGQVDIGEVEPASLDYTLGYLLKARKEVRWPIEHRYPEFRMFSPGIGKLALPHLLIDGTELPREFSVFGRTWPIPRYLRDRAKKMGFTVSERESVRLERLEAQAMRSVLADKTLSPTQIEEAYNALIKRKQEKSAELQKRAIRDAYRQIHGHLKRNHNETL